MAIFNTVKTALQSKLVPWIVAALAVVVAALAAWRLGWMGRILGSPWFWMAVLFAFAGAVFAAIRWGLPWLRERSFLSKEGSEYLAAGEASPQELSARFLKALRTLASLPQLRGQDDPLYALPWCLFIGEGGAGKTAALLGAEVFSPLLPRPKDTASTQNFDWWVSNGALIIDTAGRYAFPIDAVRDRAEWYRLLRLLRRHRERGAINGLMIAVAADKLASQSGEALRGEASKLRERIEEAVRELGVDFPLYVLVTKCDLIEGLGEFFQNLSERVRGEALGYVDDPAPRAAGAGQASRGADALRRFASGLQSIYDRLHLFRLSILDGGKVTDDLGQAVFCFPEEFKALTDPLTAFVEPLINEDVRYHTPLFRGVFFASSEQQGQPFSMLRRGLALPPETQPLEEGHKHYFLRDLFDVVLPRDRNLATTTERAKKRRGLAQVVGLAGGGGLALAAALFLAKGYMLDRRIVAGANEGVCVAAAGKISRPLLKEADGCFQVVRGLVAEERQRPRWSSWFFHRGRNLERALQERYVRKFKTEVLVPLNEEMDRSFQGSSDPLPLTVMLARRIQLGERCASAMGCSDLTTDDLQLDAQLMLNPTSDRKYPPEDLAKVRETYASYLTWQDGTKEALHQDLAEDESRLQRWLSAKQFNPDRLIQWANRRSPPLTMESYWELPQPIGVSAAPQIEAACTRKVWEEQVAPFLQQVQDAVPEVVAELRTFEDGYRTLCLGQWQRFLASFPQGEERWKGTERRRTLALKLLSDESPYRRVIDDAFANLALWIPEVEQAAPAPSSAPAWTGDLKRYAASDQKKAYQESLKKIGAKLDRASFSETSFKLAQDAFAERKPSEESANPILKAWSLAAQIRPPGPDGSQKQSEDIMGPLVREPIHYVWRVILDEVGLSLQSKWAENVIAPLKGLSAAEQIPLVYGPGGKVDGYVDQFVRPFLEGDEPRPVTLLGETVPLSPSFFQVLGNAKQLKPVLEGGGAPYSVRVRSARRSDVEGGLGLVEDETVLSIACSTKSYRVSSRPQDPAEAEANVLWTYQGCADVAITVYFSERGQPPGGAVSPGAARLKLTKRHSGQTGFLCFLQEFADGSHRFPIDDFAGADPEAGSVLKYGVSAIKVYYRVEIPPSLSKLVAALQGTGPPVSIFSPASPLT